MATLAPARQPFGLLQDSHLRSLQSAKNCQNSLASSPAPSLKRRHASPDASDSENVDPIALKSFIKRKRADLNDDVSLPKPSRYSLSTIPSKTRSSDATTFTPRLDTDAKSTTPFTAPAAAGRSPTRSKRNGLLGKQRFVPPSFGIKSPSLSIAAALSGTLAHKKTRKARTIEESKPKSWFFSIYEEREEQQEYTVNEWTMTQSANILDISDDESKAKSKTDRGKENIDPNEAPSAPVTRSQAKAAVEVAASRKDLMTDEARCPLGDLNPADYYTEGLDATSVVLVQEEVSEKEEHASINKILASDTKAEFTFEAMAELENLEDTHVDLAALVASSVAANDLDNAETLVDETEVRDEAEACEIEIWESESAKDEQENVPEGVFAV